MTHHAAMNREWTRASRNQRRFFWSIVAKWATSGTGCRSSFSSVVMWAEPSLSGLPSSVTSMGRLVKGCFLTGLSRPVTNSLSTWHLPVSRRFSLTLNDLVCTSLVPHSYDQTDYEPNQLARFCFENG